MTRAEADEHGGGAIVNTSSEAGLVGTPLAGPYVAAKHAVISLTKTAEAFVWLSSDRASFVTGIVLSIDGGATSHAQSYDPVLSPSA